MRGETATQTDRVGARARTIGRVNGTYPITLTYTVRAFDDAYNTTLKNAVTATGNRPPKPCRRLHDHDDAPNPAAGDDAADGHRPADHHRARTPEHGCSPPEFVAALLAGLIALTSGTALLTSDRKRGR